MGGTASMFCASPPLFTVMSLNHQNEFVLWIVDHWLGGRFKAFKSRYEEIISLCDMCCVDIIIAV